MVDNSDKSLNFAIIGFGKIADERHQYAIPDNGGNICCIVDNKIKESPIEGVPLYRSIEEAKKALEEKNIKIDAVSICTPPHTHAEIAKNALNHGCHVLLEKPPVLNLSDLDELEKLAKEKGKTLFLAYHTASSPAVLELQRILESKNVLQIDANFFEEVTMWHNIDEWIFNKDKSGGGITMDIGINAFSAICRTMPNAQFKLIDCDLVAEKGYPVDTKATIVFEDIISGAKGQINLNWFNGRENKDVRKIKYTTDSGVFVLNLSTARLSGEREGEEVEIETGREQEYEKVYEEFFECIKNGTSYAPKKEITFIKDVYRLDEEKNPEGKLPII